LTPDSQSLDREFKAQGVQGPGAGAFQDIMLRNFVIQKLGLKLDVEPQV
jgi:hypothetical protein